MDLCIKLTRTIFFQLYLNFLSASIALLAFKVVVVVAAVVVVIVVVAPNLLSFCSDNRSKELLLQFEVIQSEEGNIGIHHCTVIKKA